MNLAKKVFGIFCCLLLIVSFQNCSQPGEFIVGQSEALILQGENSQELASLSAATVDAESEIESDVKSDPSEGMVIREVKNGASDVEEPKHFVCSLVVDDSREDGSSKIGVINSAGGWQNTLLEIACVSEVTCAQVSMKAYKVGAAIAERHCVQKANGYREFTAEQLQKAINEGKAIRAIFPGKLVM